MDPFQTTPKQNRTGAVAMVIAAIALGLVLYSSIGNKPHAENVTSTISSVPSILKKISDKGVIDAGYGVYPPYTIEDPNTKAVTGFSIDLIERIAADLKVKVVWHRVNWNTFIPDIKRGEYDILVDPILMTIPRCREFAFTDPYDYFADGVVVVRKSETRFTSFDDLNQAGIKIAVGKGFASETVARGRLPKVEVIPVQMSTDMQQLFNEVASGRVDATLSEGPSAERYIKEHPDVVKSINLESPAAMIPGAFALRFDDAEGARAFSVCLSFLRSTGEVDALRKKWGLPKLKTNQGS
jgi:ABC-type amino acid transport substrate-binding protein